MTKDELAKKRGIKLPKEPQNPSAALITTKNEQNNDQDNQQANIPSEIKESEKSTKETQLSSKANTTTKTEQNDNQNSQPASKQSEKDDAKNNKKAPVKAKTKKNTTAKKSVSKKTENKQEQTGQPQDDPVKPEMITKNKGGRPKTRTEDIHILNIAVPLSVYNEMIDKALLKYKGNQTEYINSLIKDDLEKNKALYTKLSKLLK